MPAFISRDQQCEYTNDFVAVIGIPAFPAGDTVAINTTGETGEATGLGIVLGGTELLIDPPFEVGCFVFEDVEDSLVTGQTARTVNTAKENLINLEFLGILNFRSTYLLIFFHCTV